MRKLFALILAAALLTTPVLAAGESEDTGSTAADPAVCAHHFELTVLREATCADKGLVAYTCSKCGLTYTSETLADGEHDYELARTTATCTEAGKNTYVCTRCGDTYQEDAPAAGHVPDGQPASCTHSQSCSVCGEILEPATGHDYQYQYDAQQDEDGTYISYGTWKCANCGRTLAATEGNALYYASVPTERPASATDALTDADAASATDADTGAGDEDSPAEPSPETEDSAGAPDPKNGMWLVVSAIALVLIVAEAVVLVRSLSKKKVER